MSSEPIGRGAGLSDPAAVRAVPPTAPAARQRDAAPVADLRRRPAGPMCVVVTELADGDGQTLVQGLRRRGSGRVIALTRRAPRRELVTLLAGGLRGAVAFDPSAPDHPDRSTGPFARTRPELTTRELSVLRLVAEGCSNRSIGEQLGLSALTVKSHLARISRKLGTGDRAGLVAIALRTGLLT